MVRGDPSGSAALLLCNFHNDLRELRLPKSRRTWRLALWNGEARFGSPADGHPPPSTLERDARAVSLGGFGAALYLAEPGE